MHKSNTPKVLKKIEAYAMYLPAGFEFELKSGEQTVIAASKTENQLIILATECNVEAQIRRAKGATTLERPNTRIQSTVLHIINSGQVTLLSKITNQ